MLFESACIPLPSEVILPFGGYLAASGAFSAVAVALVATVGGTMGSIFAYLVGYYGGYPLILRYGRYVLLNKRHLDAAVRWFERHGAWAVFIGRLLPGIRTFISLPAGVGRMPFGTFVLFTLLGALPWNFALTYAGVALGANWEILQSYFHEFDLFLIAALVIAVALIVWRLWAQHRRARI
ncbi:MAG: DedA family protein [Firmicutes bacterium]|nr:DedA family protein [Bacillota bacterium]